MSAPKAEAAGHPTLVRCRCGHVSLHHGEVLGQTDCRKRKCPCPGWQPTERQCLECGATWDADGPEACPEEATHSDMAAIIRQAIHNSHDQTYRFPEDVEAHVERVTALLARERDEARAVVERVRALVRNEKADEFRAEAARGVAQLPYANNRYVRLLDDIRAVIDTATSEGA